MRVPVRLVEILDILLSMHVGIKRLCISSTDIITLEKDILLYCFLNFWHRYLLKSFNFPGGLVNNVLLVQFILEFPALNTVKILKNA